jgi:hypothetical protein
LGNDYFITLVGIVNLSLEKLMLESITGENDVETRNQTDFLLNLISYYVNLRIKQGSVPDIIQLISLLTVTSGINKVLKDQKDSIISYMAYSSVLRLLWKLLIPLPFDVNRKNQAIDIVFMKYLTSLIPNFSKIVSTLKNNIYLPIFQLVS